VLSYYRECDVRLEDIAAARSQAISRFVKADMGTSRSHYCLEGWDSGQWIWKHVLRRRELCSYSLLRS